MLKMISIVMFCTICFPAKSQSDSSDVRDRSFAISGFALKNGDFSKTMFLSLNYRQLTKINDNLELF